MVNRVVGSLVYPSVVSDMEASVRTVHVGPAVALASGVALLSGLANTVGLTVSGYVVGLGFGLAANALLVRALWRSKAMALGWANAITLARATLAGGLAALVASSFSRPTATTAIVLLAAFALALDAVDGWVARRTGTVSRLGARFDGEVDAFLILVLSVLAARSFGPWVLVIGLMRYAFFAAGVLPWMRAQLPPRHWRRVVAGVQGVVLTAVVAGVLPLTWEQAALALALALLIESFARDVWWLWTQRRSSPAAGRRTAVGLAISRAASIAAPVLVWAALVAPDHPADLRLTTFLRIPVEALLIVAAAVVLPARPRWLLAVLAGLMLAWLTVVRALDIGFGAVLDRPFDVINDWYLIGPALGVLRDSVGPTRTMLLTALVIALFIASTVCITAAMIRVTRVAARHRAGSLQTVVSLGLVCALGATLSVTAGVRAPFVSVTAAKVLVNEVQLVRTSLRDQRAFHGGVSAADPFARTPQADLLAGLRGKDVLLVFVESYGRVAVEDSAESRSVDAVLGSATASLRSAGFSSRSAFLTSPTFGGSSWLAHSTLQSGLWINNQRRYGELLRSGRFTLSEAFQRAGWRTVVDIPSSKSPWLEGRALYHFQTMYGTTDVGYAGPSFSYAKIPDQYTLAALYQRELAAHPRKPVMAEVDLVSSHVPWAPLPRMVPWQDLGNGKIFGPMPSQGQQAAELFRNRNKVPAAYGKSIEYSVTALTSFLQTFADKNMVVVMLGDHQPATVVSGYFASHDVPITIIARDNAVMRAIAPWGWQDGMLPSKDAPLWPMDTFRNRFFTAFDTPPGRQAAAPGAPR